jgi:predicted transcriptional regulator
MVGLGFVRVVLAVVAALSTIGVIFTSSAGAEGPPASLLLPLLRVGDSAQYHVNGTEPNLALTEFTLEHLDRIFWNVTGTATKIDENGSPHETVAIEKSDHGVNVNANGSLTPRGSRSVRYFEPSTRSLVQTLGETASMRPAKLATNTIGAPARFDGGTTTYGPSFGGSFAPWDGLRNLVAIQGRLLTEGDDLSGWFGPHLDPMMKQRGPTAGGTYSLRVGSGGMWGTEPAIAVEERAIVWFPPIPGASDGGKYWDNTTWWFVASIPVPVRMQFDEYADEISGKDGHFSQWRYRVMEDLVSFERGAQDIDWGPGLRPLSTGAPRALEWSLKRYPESGRDSQIPIPIEDAVRAVENDHTLPRFELWKAQNPGWQPVGFHTTYLRSGPAYSTQVVKEATGWYLFLSAPFGQRIVEIRVAKAGDTLVVNRCSCDQPEPGADPTDPPGTLVPAGRRFDPAWLPERMSTLGAGHRFWADLTAGDPAYGSPSDAQWGYSIASALNPSTNLPRLLSQSRYGSRTFDGPNPYTTTERWAYAYVNVSTGQAIQAGLTRIEPVPASVVAPFQTSNAPLALPAEPNTAKSFLPIMWGAATVSLTALLLTLLIPWAKQFFVGLYSTLRREEVLDHALRDQLITMIERNPGISQPLMQSQTRAGWSTLTYHLSILSSKSLVTSLRDGRHRRYFRVGALDHGLLAGQAKLANPGTRRVFDMIQAQPGIDRATLTRLLGLAKSSISWHLDRLKEGGLVRSEPRGRRIAYFASEPKIGIARLATSPALSTPMTP